MEHFLLTALTAQEIEKLTERTTVELLGSTVENEVLLTLLNTSFLN